MNSRIILDLCGGTGAWSAPYRRAGYDVRIVTTPKNDVRLFIPPPQVYGILAAPPCTHLAGSGARWWANKGASALISALSIVDACLRVILITRPKFWALENPVGRLRRFLGPPKMIFSPCDFGDAYTKRTLLWGEFNVPKLCPVTPTEGSKMHTCYGGASKNTKSLRSVTPRGFARAFFNANR